MRRPTRSIACSTSRSDDRRRAILNRVLDGFVNRPTAPKRRRNEVPNVSLSGDNLWRTPAMRSILLMFLGVPLPIILLLAFCTHHF
jgi:hypothetical protein